MHDAEVRLAFFKEVGQQADFQAVLEHDLVGANARARLVDERRAKEVPSEATKRPATRLATAILMYSFGGLRREGVTALLIGCCMMRTCSSVGRAAGVPKSRLTCAPRTQRGRTLRGGHI